MLAEEALRNYFLTIGYFAVRSVPFYYGIFDVTDVDIWLYIKSSSLARERVCVDIKNKKTPQAMERVLWTKGMREILGAERAIVVTTDNRKETREFGAANGITVLHGRFVQKVLQNYSSSSRITEEELLNLLLSPCIIEPKVEWRRWYQDSKAMLLNGLNFNGCNKFLMRINLLLQEYLATSKATPLPVRLFYLLIAFFLLSLDYASRSLAHLDTDERKQELADGIRYGEAGRGRTEEIVDMALHLLAESGKTDLFSETSLKEEFRKQLSDYPADILAEHFSKSGTMKSLFELARSFEAQAYSKQITYPHECQTEQKALIGLLCDFMKIDRRDVI